MYTVDVGCVILLCDTMMLNLVQQKGQNTWVLYGPEAVGQFNTATSKIHGMAIATARMEPRGVSVQRHTHTHEITNETLNVNGLTRVINLSVAAGQQGSASQQSCQNSAAV